MEVSDEKVKTPRLYSRVYIVNNSREIKMMYVYAKNTKSFIPSSSKNWYWNENEYDEQNYVDFGNTWFSTLRDAKNCLRLVYKDYYDIDNIKFIKWDGDLWGVDE